MGLTGASQGHMRLRHRTPREQDPCRGAAAPRRETTRRPSVIDDVIARWHRYLGGQLPGGLDQLLSDDVVFFSPVVYTPQRGKRLAIQYLEAASRALAGEAAADGPGKRSATPSRSSPGTPRCSSSRRAWRASTSTGSTSSAV